MGMPVKDTSGVALNGRAARADAIDAAMIASAQQTVGDRLAAVRKAKGLSYQDVFNGTKIKIANLAAIESGDRAALPATPFTAGFVKAYAQFLGLDPETYAAAYRAELIAPSTNGEALPQPVASSPEPAAIIRAPGAPTLTQQFEPAPPASSRNAQPLRPENFVSYFGVAATALCALWIGGRIIAPKGEPAAPISRVETVAAGPGAAALAAAAPASPSLKPAGGADANASGAAQGRIGEDPTRALVDRQETGEGGPAPGQSGSAAAAVPDSAMTEAPTPLSQSEREKAEALAAALNPRAERNPTAPATPSRKPTNAANTATEELAPPAVEVPSPAPAAAVVTPPPQDPKVVEARLTRNVEPKYPERCTRRAAAVETVELAFAITPLGAPTGVYVVDSSNECFNSAAVNAAYDLRFAPKTVDGKAVQQDGKRITLRFAR